MRTAQKYELLQFIMQGKVEGSLAAEEYLGFITYDNGLELASLILFRAVVSKIPIHDYCQPSKAQHFKNKNFVTKLYKNNFLFPFFIRYVI